MIIYITAKENISLKMPDIFAEYYSQSICQKKFKFLYQDKAHGFIESTASHTIKISLSKFDAREVYKGAY